MELTHPWFLALAPLLALFLWRAQRRSLAGMPRRQRLVCLGLRALLLLLVLLALAGWRILWPSHDVAVYFAVDDSASLSDAARAQARAFVAASRRAAGAHTSAGVIGFARPATVWEPLDRASASTAPWPVSADRGGTNIGGALDLAGALLPATGSRRVVLLSDGQETEGNAAEAARRLGCEGARVFTVPLRNAAAPEVLMEQVSVPRQVKTGEPFDLTATIRSNVETPARVKLYQNRFLVEQRAVSLHRGVNEFRAPNLQAEGSFVAYEVEVLAERDTLAENNRATATATVKGEPRVLAVDSDEKQLRPFAEALRREKISVETRGPSGLPQTLEDLQQFDLLMLSDLSALKLSRGQMELYRRWVQELGGGFLMLGGENSYGVGGYYRTPIEQMLPVRMEHDDRQDTPSVALLVVLDRSGSMTAQTQGQTKISLADQGAVFAMNALQPKDFFGVIAVDTRAHQVVPLGQLTAREAADQKIMTINAGGGGIYIYTSLVEAFQVMRDVNARIKHVILFSDAADAEEKAAGEMGDGARSGGTALDLAAAMLSAKITVSVVGLGTEQDKDTAFLRQLAERGNGRFYLTSDATTLPQIFSTETMRVAQSSLMEEPFLAVPSAPSTWTRGIDWAQAPLLLGYNTTKPKPTGEVLLATERGEPLLATWRYGLGQAVAFTSDVKSRWAAEWLTWPGFGKFWAQVVRGAMRRSDQSGWQVSTEEEGEALKVEVEAVTPEGGFRNQWPIHLRSLAPDGATHETEAEQFAPGRYRARLPLPKDGTALVSVSSPRNPEGGYVFGQTQGYPREFVTNETNEAALRQWAEAGKGQYDPKPEEVFAPDGHFAPAPRDLTDAFLIAFLLLMPVDIWLRRRRWGETGGAR